jgi:ATP-dependent DNA ligase
LIYVARTRNGFTPVTRAQLFKKFKGLEIGECPFANLPEARSGRWGQGLAKAKMAECQWLKPVLVGQFEFLEWTGDNHLRHSKFVGLREDKKAKGCRSRMNPFSATGDGDIHSSLSARRRNSSGTERAPRTADP